MAEGRRGSYVEESYERDTTYITDRIVSEGGSTDGAGGRWPVEPGRYRLVVAWACPWANRTIIVRRLLGLEGVISLGICGPTPHEAGAFG